MLARAGKAVQHDAAEQRRLKQHQRFSKHIEEASLIPYPNHPPACFHRASGERSRLHQFYAAPPSLGPRGRYVDSARFGGLTAP
jgi:hypothetical protein